MLFSMSVADARAPETWIAAISVSNRLTVEVTHIVFQHRQVWVFGQARLDRSFKGEQLSSSRPRVLKRNSYERVRKHLLSGVTGGLC